MTLAQASGFSGRPDSQAAVFAIVTGVAPPEVSAATWGPGLQRLDGHNAGAVVKVVTGGAELPLWVVEQIPR